MLVLSCAFCKYDNFIENNHRIFICKKCKKINEICDICSHYCNDMCMVLFSNKLKL